MKKYDKFCDAWEELSDNEKIACFNEYAREHNSDDEIFDFDDNFFDEQFCGNPSEAVRASHFGEINSWNDEYIRFNGYGNLVSMTESEAVDFAEIYLDDIFKHEEIWCKYIEIEEDEEEGEDEE